MQVIIRVSGPEEWIERYPVKEVLQWTSIVVLGVTTSIGLVLLASLSQP